MNNWRVFSTKVVTLVSLLSFLSVGQQGFAAEGEAKAIAEYKQAQDLITKKNYEEALPLLDKAIEHDRKMKDAYLMRAKTREILKKHEVAIDDYNEYALLDPSNSDVLLRMSDLYGKLDKPNLSLSYLSKALLLKPKDGTMYFKRAALYDKLSQKELAVQDREVARRLGVTKLASAAPEPSAHIQPSKASTHPSKTVVKHKAHAHTPAHSKKH